MASCIFNLAGIDFRSPSPFPPRETQLATLHERGRVTVSNALGASGEQPALFKIILQVINSDNEILPINKMRFQEDVLICNFDCIIVRLG